MWLAGASAAIAGPLGLVRNGDQIMPDARRGVLDVPPGERELARHASEQRPSRPARCRGHEVLIASNML
jgi:dihydroxy-acid dehydratase